MASLSVTSPLTDASTAWLEIVAHPELVWGFYAPDLAPEQDFQVLSYSGGGAAGRIESVEHRRVSFTWGQPHWPEPGHFVLSISDVLRFDASHVPEAELSRTSAHWQLTADAAGRYLRSRNAPTDAAPSALLFDADGVLQMPRPGWLERFVQIGGEEFVVDAFAAELDCLAGKADLRPMLQSLLQRAGTGGTVDQVLAAWHDIVVDPDALALVAQVRQSGLTVGPATNQQSYRGAHMRNVLDLDRHFDHTFYSYEVGHAKPSTAYFEQVAAQLQVPAGQIAFVDDAPANIVGARAAGLQAVLHRSSGGANGLADDLRSLGVPLPGLDSLGSTR